MKWETLALHIMLEPLSLILKTLRERGGAGSRDNVELLFLKRKMTEWALRPFKRKKSKKMKRSEKKKNRLCDRIPNGLVVPQASEL